MDARTSATVRHRQAPPRERKRRAGTPLLERFRRHVRRECDRGSASMASYVVAASLFVVGTSYMIQFVVDPPGSSVSNLEHIALKNRGQQALEVLLGTPGIPVDWSATSQDIDRIDRLGLIDRGSSARVNATKFDALAQGSYATTSPDNGAVDYHEAKLALGFEGHEFHLRAYPIDRKATEANYGVTGMDTFRVAYVGKFTGSTYSTNAKFEADALDNLPITFTNATRSSSATGDVYEDNSNAITQHLIPNLGTLLPQEVLGAGSGTKYDFMRVPSSAYSSFLTLNTTSTLTSAMALTSDGHTLGYTKNRELRVIAATANFAGTSGTGPLGTINWHEWVDTDRGNGTRDCNDYGYVEVSPDGGVTWTKLTDTPSLRSQDCGAVGHLPGLTHRAVGVTGTNCAACANNEAVLVAFHWTADNDNDIGYGWVVDDLQVVLTGSNTVAARKTFEKPEYDLLVVGSDASHTAFTPNAVKNAIRDYVDIYGGRILVLGGESNRAWLDRLLAVGSGGTSGGVATPDTSHPILTLPNILAHETYTASTVWDLSSHEALFATVTGTDSANAKLAISRQGVWNSNGEDGALTLTSYKPGEWGKTETRKFFANSIVYGKYHYLYLEMGPPVPTDISVASVTRSATMNIMRTGAPEYQEMAFVMYVWPGISSSVEVGALSVRPTQPATISASATTGQAWVNWTAPTSTGTGTPLSYEVWRGNGPSSMTTLVANRTLTGTSADLTFHDPTATDGQTWWYNVTMWASNGRGRPSAGVSALPLQFPSAPPSATASATLGRINVSWTEPITTGPGPIYGYRIWVKVAPSPDFTILADVGNTTYLNYSVADTESYSYKVSALNGRGWSPNSTETSPVSAPLASPIAGPALSITRIGAGPNNLTLTWVNPIDLMGQSLTGFKIWRSAGASNASYSLLASPGSANLSFTDATLGASETRYYKVQPVTSVMDGYNSSPQSGTTYALAAAPGSFTVTNLTAGTLSLSWTAPDTDGLSLLGYKIHRSLDDVTFTPLVTLAGATGPLNLTFVDATVAANTTYFYKIQGFTSAGDGTLTASASKRTLSAPWGIDGLGNPSRTLGISVNFSWNVPNSGGSPILNYEIWRGATQGAETHLGVSLTPSYLDLTTGSTYYWYKVRANNSLGSGPWSASVHMLDLPSPPTLTLSNTTAHQIGLSWNTPASNGGTISGYHLQRSPDGSTWTTLSSSTSAANRTWTDLAVADNTSYTYRIATITEAGTSTWSASATRATTGVPWPVSLTLTNTTVRTIAISWNAANQGGGTYSTYTLQRSLDGSTWTHVITTSNTNRSWTDATVSDNTTYHYRVLETNDVGSGAWSASASRATKGLAWAPTGLAKTGSVPGVSISMSWNVPNNGGSTITGYEIWRDGGATAYATSVTASYTDLSAGAGSHTYRVRAINGVGNGPFSATVTMSS